MALSRITNYIEADGADLNLQSSDTTITDGSVLGVINFKAPSEASGTDSILLASKIEAVAEGTFSASSNATELVFFTASSEAAGTAGGGKMVMSSTGNLTLKDTRTADGSSPTITLQTGDTDIAQDDVLGTINFQAPDEGTGTDAILVAAGIAAVSEGDFSSSSNATKLSFKTGASETAAEKMSLSSGGDLSILTDGASIFFGADSEIELRHVADDGLILKHVGTGDGKEPSLTFQAGDNDIAQDDILGSIFFQAPDEGAGTDAVLVSAGIEAISEGDFSSSSNATSLRFLTGASETAAEKMRIASDGKILVNHTSSQTMGPTTEPQIQIEGTDHHTGSMSIIRNSNDNGQSLLILGKSRGTSVNANTVVQDDDNVGEVLFVAADGSDKTPQVASIRGAIDGTPGSNDMPGRLVFSTTADGAQTISERMRIDKDGAVAIGTSTPNNFSGFQCLTMGGAAATTGCVFDMEDSDGGIDGRVFAQDSFIAIAADPSNASSSSKISFQVDSTEFAKIKTSGHIASRAGATNYLGSTANFHEVQTTETNLALFRMAAATASYADEGVQIGMLRDSSSSTNLLTVFHGNGSNDLYIDRMFAVSGTGQIFSDASTSITSGADYAEYFEWKDGNSSNEDRIGQSVVLDGNKIRKATSSDSASSIIGVISGNPSVVGDSAELRWQGKWELDDFNRRQTEERDVWEWKDKDGYHSYESNKVPEGITVPSDKTVNKVVNDKYSSSYDASKKDDYVPRSQRKEWDAVGLMGKLRMLKGQPTGDRWIKMRDISDTVEEWLVR